MFIKKIVKKNKNSDKRYVYYRLIHGYKIGDKTRHQTVLNLGKLEGLDKKYHKMLADRIEAIISGTSNSLFSDYQINKEVEEFAQDFSKKIISEKLFSRNRGSKKEIAEEVTNRYQEVDLETMEDIESRSMGGEWLMKQTMDRLSIPHLFSSIGLSEEKNAVAQMLLMGKALHPGSELETERWLGEQSAYRGLYDIQHPVSRYKLYQAATALYEHKEDIERGLYNKIKNLFSGKNKIVIYDLTNMYFEGQMLGSKKAAFGRSKQKQSGSKLIGLALSIDQLGFMRYSKFYKGNIGEPATFQAMLKEVVTTLDNGAEKPVVVMDAGIATEENLATIRNKPFEYDYVCVSRSRPKEYHKLTDQATAVEDNRGHKIALTKVSVEDKPDSFLHIKSAQKEKKEEAIDKKLSDRFEAQLQDIKNKLPKPGTLKKSEKIHEKVGNIKARLSKVGWLYKIKYTEDKEKGIVTDMTWERIKKREKPKGEYFLRYTKEAVSEEDIWDIYNLTRSVESVFRCLKTDLDIRPIFHQKDDYIEPHIWLGLVAYQMVNYIRTNLQQQDIHYSWTTIVNKLKTMQSSIVGVNKKDNKKIYINLCTRPTTDQSRIFEALGFKERPFVRKTKVVPQL